MSCLLGSVCSCLVRAARRLQLFPCPFEEFIMLFYMPSYGKGRCSSNKLGWNNHSFLANTAPDLKLCSETKELSLSLAAGRQCWSLSSVPVCHRCSWYLCTCEGKGGKYFYFGYAANVPSSISARKVLFPW